MSGNSLESDILPGPNSKLPDYFSLLKCKIWRLGETSEFELSNCLGVKSGFTMRNQDIQGVSYF